jgi:ribose transport system substrate-binding protein
MMSRLVHLRPAAWLAILGIGLSMTGCGPKGAGPESGSEPTTKRFIFLTNGDDPFWDACNAGLQQGAKQADLASKGLTVVMEKNNGTAQGQIEKLRQFGSQPDIAGVAISVIQAENTAIADEMRNLASKGVHVITVDGDVNRDTLRDARPYYIGTDNVVAGQVLGRAAAVLLGERGLQEGDYVQFAGFTDNDNARARMNGFQEAVGESFTQVDRMSDEMDLSRARDNVRSSLVNHPELVALVGIWAYNAPAIAEVVDERGAGDQTTVVTFDAQAAAIDHMAAGRIDAMVVQNPFDMGVKAVRLLLAMFEDDQAAIDEMFPNSEAPDGDILTTGLRIIIPEEGSPLEGESFDPVPAERMTLPAFREWLAAYGLTSS